MLSLTAFKTMNTMVAVLCLRRTFGSQSATKLHWPTVPNMQSTVLVHYVTRVAFGLVGKDKTYQRALTTNRVMPVV